VGAPGLARFPHPLPGAVWHGTALWRVRQGDVVRAGWPPRSSVLVFDGTGPEDRWLVLPPHSRIMAPLERPRDPIHESVSGLQGLAAEIARARPGPRGETTGRKLRTRRPVRPRNSDARLDARGEPHEEHAHRIGVGGLCSARRRRSNTADGHRGFRRMRRACCGSRDRSRDVT
jgi:hypothetical protein